MTNHRQLGYATIIGLAITAVIVGASCIPHCDFFVFLILRGALLAALPFPQGVEGDAAFAYLVLAGLIDILLYSLLAYVIMRRWFWKSLTLPVLLLACLTGCHSTPVPTTPAATQTTTPQYPPHPTTPPPPFHLFHQTPDTLTLVVPGTTTDTQLSALLWQLRDAAQGHGFDALHIPQKLVDARDPKLWFHIYRGPKCAAEKYAAGAYPCGPSYHAAADFTLGGFKNRDRAEGTLLQDEDHQTELWNPDTQESPAAKAALHGAP